MTQCCRCKELVPDGEMWVFKTGERICDDCWTECQVWISIRRMMINRKRWVGV